MKNPDLLRALQKAEDAPSAPFELFYSWFKQAGESEPVDHNAMSLATTGSDGRPHVRIVLLKGMEEDGFVFYTNRESRKAKDLEACPYAALCFHWKSLGRQVRIEGKVSPVSDEESDAYYFSRPRGSRIGAWASRQSAVLGSRQELADRVRTFEDKFSVEENIPRPPHWGGYRVVPGLIEFWDEGEFRLHTRLVYERTASDAWDRKMIYP